MEFKFTHNLFDFSPVGMVAKLGVMRGTPLYPELLITAFNIIETQVSIAAFKLNQRLKEEYRKDMLDIDEYAAFPRYISTMEVALSKPPHVGVYWDARGVVQAKFVDTDLLGNLSDLHDIQKAVYPAGGTLQGWIFYYEAWRAGRSNKYEEIVNQRLDLMTGRAPFWELIEMGNGWGAWPRNGPKHTLTNFADTYRREMLRAYGRCIQLLQVAALTGFKGFAPATKEFQGVTYYGYKWTSLKGREVFIISGTERVVAGRMIARGFIFYAGRLIPWSGWLPK